MPRHEYATFLLTALVAGTALSASFAQESPPSAEQVRFFESEVRPLLVEHCAKCHGPKKPKAGLRLDSRTAMLTGGDTGPAVVPGKPNESLLIEAIAYKGPEMPPSGKLPKEKVETLTRWVQMGAPWPGGDESAPSPTRRGPFQITDKDRSHWAFRPIATTVQSERKDWSASSNPIDAFILARLETKGLHANPQASQRELIRRATYDLTGSFPLAQGGRVALQRSRLRNAYERSDRSLPRLTPVRRENGPGTGSTVRLRRDQ